MNNDPPHYYVDASEKPLQEKCGIIAIYTPIPTKQLYSALLAAGGVQHRGQHGAGIAIKLKKSIVRHVGVGLLKEIFTPTVIKRLDKQSIWTLIHCRYGTSGGYIKENLQPCITTTKDGSSITVIHNGEFVASNMMKKKIKTTVPNGVSDTYLFTKLVSQAKGSSWEEKVLTTLSQVDGAYSLAIGINDTLFLARDRFGIRPFILGKFLDGWIAASETHALNKLGIPVVREIKQGEVIRIDKKGLTILRTGSGNQRHFCDFEWAYFSRPNSRLPICKKKSDYKNPDEWLSVATFREHCGEILAKERPINRASFVVGVPDSGITVAIGYANALKLPYRQVIIRDHFDPDGNQRLFMRDDQKEMIKNKVLGKLSFVSDKHIWKNAVVVVGDDSIVRGNVIKKVTKVIFSLGAKEVHWIIGFPPVAYRCHLGISMRTKEELIAARHNGNIEKITKEVGATSVTYISKKGFIQARLLSGTSPIPHNSKEILLMNGGCGGCITGQYPISRAGKIHPSLV